MSAMNAARSFDRNTDGDATSRAAEATLGPDKEIPYTREQHHPLFDVILDRKWYIDTVYFQARRHLSPADFMYIKAHCLKFWRKALLGRGGETYGSTYIAQLPDEKAIVRLASYPLRISRVEIALDLITTSDADAFEVHQWLETHLVIDKCPREPILHKSKCEGTAYTSYIVHRKSSRYRQIALYSDLPSKVTDQSCCHVEVRLRGSAFTRAEGLQRPDDLLSFDGVALFAKYLRLWNLPSALQLGLAALRSRKQVTIRPSESSLERDRRAYRDGSRILRMARDSRHVVTAHGLHLFLVRSARLCGSRASRLFSSTPNDVLLPHGGNSYWGLPEHKIRVKRMELLRSVRSQGAQEGL